MLVGAHISIAGGVEKAPERAKKIGCEIMQVFTKNQMQWKAKKLSEDSINNFKKNVKKFDIKEIIVHDSYLINLGSSKKSLLEKSRRAFLEEMKRCEALGIRYLIFHPGSHMGSGEEACLKTIADSLNFIHSRTKGYKVISVLETTAGQGTNVGYKFEHLAKIIKMVKQKKRMGVCYDTCHSFAAGYDIRTKKAYEKTFREFDKIIGIKKIKAFHLNDSRGDLGSRIDRHADIGKGKIGKNAFRLLMKDRRFKLIPGAIERPYENSKRCLKVLKKLRK